MSFVVAFDLRCISFSNNVVFNVVRDARSDFGQHGGALLLERTSRPTSLFAELTSILPHLHPFFSLVPSASSRFSPRFDRALMFCLFVVSRARE